MQFAMLRWVDQIIEVAGGRWTIWYEDVGRWNAFAVIGFTAIAGLALLGTLIVTTSRRCILKLRLIAFRFLMAKCPNQFHSEVSFDPISKC